MSNLKRTGWKCWYVFLIHTMKVCSTCYSIRYSAKERGTPLAKERILQHRGQRSSEDSNCSNLSLRCSNPGIRNVEFDQQVKNCRDRKIYLFPCVRSLPILLSCFSAIQKSLNFEIVEHLEPTRDGETAKYSSPHCHSDLHFNQVYHFQY